MFQPFLKTFRYMLHYSSRANARAHTCTDAQTRRIKLSHARSLVLAGLQHPYGSLGSARSFAWECFGVWGFGVQGLEILGVGKALQTSDFGPFCSSVSFLANANLTLSVAQCPVCCCYGTQMQRMRSHAEPDAVVSAFQCLLRVSTWLCRSSD